MKLRAHEILRYRVLSENPDKLPKEWKLAGRKYYIVDLASYHGNGQCDCMDFRTRMEPKLSRGMAPCDQLRCKHILACRRALLDDVIGKFIALYGDGCDP